jgi:hypothetical protein
MSIDEDKFKKHQNSADLIVNQETKEVNNTYFTL